MDVSVIVPFYRGNRYINNILGMMRENAAEARNLSFEVIIVNDSPEVEIVIDDALVEGYELNIIKHNKNLGIQQARVTGIQQACGKYILMLDQDDEIKPETIKRQYSIVDGRDAIISNGYSRDKNGENIPLFKNQNQMNYVNDFSFYFYFGNVIASPGLCLIRKELIPELWLNNIMRENGADDWLLWVAFLNDGRRFVINNEFLYTHINDGHNTSNDNEKMISSSFEALQIAENSKRFKQKLLSVYHRRLNMRKTYLDGKKYSKIIAYLKNLDIAIRLAKYKKHKR